MYHKASISPLSGTQISKILNGHSIRVSPGNEHEIELSKEQFKKFARAQKTGKGMTLTMDPYQMQNHQYLRGSGSGGSVNRYKKATRWAGFSNNALNDGIDTAARAAQLGFGVGGSVNRLKKATRWAGFSNNTLNDGIDTAARAAQLGFGVGGSVNRLNKAQRWAGFSNDTLNHGIDTAARAAQLGFGVNRLNKA
jgi:hypothetical protein